jgi:type IV secretory pathway component VirB8
MVKDEFQAEIPLMTRVLLKSNRILRNAFFTAVLIIAVLSVGLTVLAVNEEKEVVYVEFVNSDGRYFVRVKKAGPELRRDEVLRSYALRQYVMNRETIDRQTENARFLQVEAMTAPEEFARFKRNFEADNNVYHIDGYKREIKITRDMPLLDDVHEIEFQMINTINGKPTRTDHIINCKVRLNFSFPDIEIDYEDRYYNPVGAIISEYILKRAN